MPPIAAKNVYKDSYDGGCAMAKTIGELVRDHLPVGLLQLNKERAQLTITTGEKQQAGSDGC